ncbi:hypothetical protein BU14_0330s0002 [Porphyra umbilicalis]|uniref:Uncharacterized protein n=1 Tax=Porphyra umbilicalis TaxID=2786 RepID=A0A1X6NYL3_PORUM|nr:hypothetical protein BU14_0330s0002 [Porphyra umbilicalis]|eukprot:OSX73711.1 hypothetical protein BU14_0330s0002 [Porphyra umbilicalis]
MAQGAVLCETGPARHVLWTGTGGSRGSRLRVHLQHLHFLTFWEVVSVSFRARIGGFASLTARELRWGAHSSACFGTVVVLCWRTEDHGRCIVSRSRRAGRPAMALYLLPFDRCPHDGCNRQKLREGVAVGVKVHSISGVVDARSLSRTCRQCGTHFKLGMTTYRTGFYKDVVVPVTLSALPIATEELDSSVGVRAHTITDNQLRVSNHHVFEASLAHLWYLHASQGRFSTETKATVRMSMGAEETLLVESDAFIGDEGDGALNQQIWASIVFYAAQLFEKRRGFNKVAWIPLFDANRAHSSQRLSLHSLCNRMVRVWQTHGYFHARHTYDKCLLPECIDFLVGDGVAMGGIVCGVERCLCPSANSKRFCAEKITNEELCAVVRQSTTLAPCAPPPCVAANALGGRRCWSLQAGSACDLPPPTPPPLPAPPHLAPPPRPPPPRAPPPAPSPPSARVDPPLEGDNSRCDRPQTCRPRCAP